MLIEGKKFETALVLLLLCGESVVVHPPWTPNCEFECGSLGGVWKEVMGQARLCNGALVHLFLFRACGKKEKKGKAFVVTVILCPFCSFDYGDDIDHNTAIRSLQQEDACGT